MVCAHTKQIFSPVMNSFHTFLLSLSDPLSSGSLFYEFVRVQQWLCNAAKKNGHSFFWLFENTFAMEIATKNSISRYMQVTDSKQSFDCTLLTLTLSP